MTIMLTGDIAARVKAAIETAQYSSVSKLMRQALRDWVTAKAWRAHGLCDLRDKMQVAREP